MLYASVERHDGNAAATVLINSNKSLLFDELQAVEDEDDDIPMNIGTTRLLLRKQTILERFAYYHSNRFFQSALNIEMRPKLDNMVACRGHLLLNTVCCY